MADDVKGTNQTYLGKEEIDAQGIPTNYVLDPYTAQKQPIGLKLQRFMMSGSAILTKIPIIGQT